MANDDFYSDLNTPNSGIAGYYDVEQRRMYGSSVGALTLDPTEVPAIFPFDQWLWQARRYLKYWNYFTGAVWTETTPDSKDENGDPILKYPLQVNPIKTASMKHSYILFGEASDQPVPLVPTRVKARKKPGKGITDTDKQYAEEAEDFINRVWLENNGRSLMQENGLLQQFLGGCVFRLNWAPDDDQYEYGIRIESVIPDFFLPVWDNGHPSNLLEAWVVYRIQPREAQLRFGIDVKKANSSVPGAMPLYIEHWTKDTINITISGNPIEYKVDNKTIRYDNIKNPFGFVPFVYIPRERAGSFYGISLVDDLEGICKEYNARMADIGDLIRDNAHRDIYSRNISGQIKLRDMGLARQTIDIGMTPSINKDPPDVFTIEAAPIPPQVMMYPDLLLAQFHADSFTPNVAYGLDEGSQRSALTLAFRMWPMTSKVRAIRSHWNDALTAMGKMIVKMAIIKGVGGMKDYHWKNLDFISDWAPMIPRDREQLVDETIAAVQTGVMSIETAIARLDIVDDPVEEVNNVHDDKTWSAQLEAQTAQASKPPTAPKTTPVSPPSKALGAPGAPFTAVE